MMLVLMAWGPGARALCDRFEMAREQILDGTRGRTYMGFVKALKRSGLRMVERAAARLRQQMMLIADHSAACFGFVAIAVDGSRFALPATAENERVFGVVGNEGAGGVGTPQLWITTMWHMALGLPWAWRIGRGNSSERGHLLSMLDEAPSRALLVMDAGFTGYELLKSIIASNRDVLLRVGRSVELLRDLYDVEHVHDQTVALWPKYAQRDGKPSLMLRLIEVRCRGKAKGARRRCSAGRVMYLLTSVLDAARLSDEQAAALYRKRWGVELCYRSLKQTLASRTLRAHAPATVLFEMHGLMLGLMLLGLMSVTVLISQQIDPLRWSVAASLRIMRRAMRHPDQPYDWREELARAIKDSYERETKSTRPWPRKKSHDQPPGKPNVRTATKKEKQLHRTMSTQ